MSGPLRARRPAALFAAALLACAPLAACSGAGNGNGFTYSSATGLGQVIPIADRKPAEDVSGPLLAGGSTTLGAYRGKVVLVTFWASWCLPCTVETPQFDLLYRRLAAKGVQVLGVNTKNQRGPAEQFVKDNDISFPNIYDFDGAVLLQLGNIPSAGLPISVLIDKRQRVAAVYTGRQSTSQLQPVLTGLLAEKT